MELTQLKYFSAVAECQHITRAAESLNISQPALSHSIRKLEQELGLPLFQRTGRNIALTAYGHSFYANVKRIFLELENANRERRELTSDLKRLYLGTNCPDILGDALLDFLEAQPMLRLRQTLIQPADCDFLLSNGKIDALIMEEVPGLPDSYYYQELGTIQLYAVLNSDHLNVSEEILPLDALRTFSKITSVADTSLRERISQLFANAGIPENHDIDVNTAVEGIRFAAMGYGGFLSSGPVLYKAMEQYTDTYDAMGADIWVIPIEGTGCQWKLLMAMSEYAQNNAVLLQFQSYLTHYFQRISSAEHAVLS